MNNIPIDSSVTSCVVLKPFGREHRMLLMNRTKDKFWCHLAGKIEEGETAWQAIIREIREEINIENSSLYSAEYIEKFYDARRNRISLFPTFVAYLTTDDEITLNEEHTEYKWCTLDEAKVLAPFPNQHRLFEHVWYYFVENVPDERMRIE